MVGIFGLILAFGLGRYSKDAKGYDLHQPGVNFGDPLPNQNDPNRIKWQLAKFLTDVVYDPLYSHVGQVCFWFNDDYEKWIKESGLELPKDYNKVMCLNGFSGGELPIRH